MNCSVKLELSTLRCLARTAECGKLQRSDIPMIGGILWIAVWEDRVFNLLKNLAAD